MELFLDLSFFLKSGCQGPRTTKFTGETSGSLFKGRNFSPLNITSPRHCSWRAGACCQFHGSLLFLKFFPLLPGSKSTVTDASRGFLLPYITAYSQQAKLLSLLSVSPIIKKVPLQRDFSGSLMYLFNAESFFHLRNIIQFFPGK